MDPEKRNVYDKHGEAGIKFFTDASKLGDKGKPIQARFYIFFHLQPICPKIKLKKFFSNFYPCTHPVKGR